MTLHLNHFDGVSLLPIQFDGVTLLPPLFLLPWSLQIPLLLFQHPATLRRRCPPSFSSTPLPHSSRAPHLPPPRQFLALRCGFTYRVPAAFVDTLLPVLVPLSSIPNPPVSAFPRTFPYCFSLDRGLPCLLALIATASAQLRFAFLTGLNCKLRLSACWRSIGDFSLIFR